MHRLVSGLLLTLALLPYAHAELKVFACEPEWGALLRELGGSDVEVYTATHAFQDPHKIEARPSLISAYRRADLLVCTGADLEAGWLPALAQKGNNPKLRSGEPGYFEAASFVMMREVPERVDRSMGDVHAKGDPHVHTDPRNIEIIAQALATRLMQIDSARGAAYLRRRDDFLNRWRAALVTWSARGEPLRGLPLVSAHKGWSYLQAWLGLVEVAVLEDKPGVPPSTGHLRSVLERLEVQPASLIISAAYQSDRPARWLSARAGIPAVTLPYTVGGADGTDDLFALFEVTLVRLLEARGD